MGFVTNPAFWACLAVLLVVSSACFALGYIARIILIVAAGCALVGIVETLWHAGHRIKYERPSEPKMGS